MIFGITGGTGCGKTTLLTCLAQAGVLVLDCDAIYHRLLQTDPSLTAAIEERFPGTVENGQLLRKKLGRALNFSKIIIKPCIASLLCVFCARTIYAHMCMAFSNTLCVFFAVVSAAAIYLILLILLSAINEHDIKMLLASEKSTPNPLH
jgi:dephospho-CoA kinase